jgi:hypothetical protein
VPHVNRRRFIPLALVGVLAVLTAVFAVLGFTGGPPGADLAVQNATAATFGAPLGSQSFSVQLNNTVSSGKGGGTLSQTRLINYTPPDRMVVYLVAPSKKLLGTLDRDAIERTLTQYAAVTTGSTPWIRVGSHFTRVESLQVYEARVPKQPSLSGKVFETAVVRDGYLVDVNLHVVIPNQTTSAGRKATGGVDGESFHLLEIDGKVAPAVTP